MPVGAYGGRGDLMRMVAPAGPVYQAGTLSGNPLATAAGMATVRHLVQNPNIYALLESRGAALEAAIARTIQTKGYPLSINRAGSMATLFFHPGPVRSWDEAAQCDRPRFARYHRALLSRGIYMPPSQFEAFFISAAHSEDDIAQTAQAIHAALDEAFAK